MDSAGWSEARLGPIGTVAEADDDARPRFRPSSPGGNDIRRTAEGEEASSLAPSSSPRSFQNASNAQVSLPSLPTLCPASSLNAPANNQLRPNRPYVSGTSAPMAANRAFRCAASASSCTKALTPAHEPCTK